MAILLSLLILLIQISFHVWARSGLLTESWANQRTGIGILYNLPDTLSYASWAYQAKLGYVTFADLFTTEEHPKFLFNLYFLIIGLLSKTTAIDPLSLMEISAFLLGPVLIFTVLLMARELKFDEIGQVLSLVLVLFGSGLSGLVAIMQMLGFQPATSVSGLSWLVGQGADVYYLDLFALPVLLFYPYHAAAVILVAVIVIASTRLFAAIDGPASTRRAMLVGVLFLILGLVRPYESVTLVLVFNLTALVSIFSRLGVRLKKTLAIGCIVNLFAFPPIAYVGFATTLPVWGSFANSSMTLEPLGSGFYLKGFAIIWSLAGLGLAFAIADRKTELCFVGIWAILSAALLCSPRPTAPIRGSLCSSKWPVGRLRHCSTVSEEFHRRKTQRGETARRWGDRNNGAYSDHSATPHRRYWSSQDRH